MEAGRLSSPDSTEVPVRFTILACRSRWSSTRCSNPSPPLVCFWKLCASTYAGLLKLCRVLNPNFLLKPGWRSISTTNELHAGKHVAMKNILGSRTVTEMSLAESPGQLLVWLRLWNLVQCYYSVWWWLRYYRRKISIVWCNLLNRWGALLA